MANINNSQLSKELIDGAKIQTSFDKIPTQLADKVVPVMEVNPKLLKITGVVKNASISNATGGTIYTLPTDKDFYLTDCALSVIKDATSTSVGSDLTAVMDGQTIYLLSVPGITLTAQNQTVTLSLKNPLKLDRGSLIRATASTNVANIKYSGTIYGYLE